MNSNTVYRGLLSTVRLSGAVVNPRNQPTREIMGYQTTVSMTTPIVTIPARNINYCFMAAEAYWILTGQQGLNELTPYCKKMAQFSDDGITLSGAYGPRFLAQAQYIAHTLAADNDTRQAVMTLWERNPRPSKDIPCTVSLQWLLRNNKLHCIAHMRSSDVWLGWPYDVFTFSMMSSYIMLLMKQLGYMTNFELGNLRVMVGSQHMYERDITGVAAVCDSKYEDDRVISPITLCGLNCPGDLLSSLDHARSATNPEVLTSIQTHLCPSK